MSKIFRFEAAHALTHLPTDHQCHNVHGHSYQVKVEVYGPVDPTTGFVIDFNELSALLKNVVVERYDHQFLNTVFNTNTTDPKSWTTAENLAERIHKDTVETIEGMGREQVRVGSITVRETEKTECVFP